MKKAIVLLGTLFVLLIMTWFTILCFKNLIPDKPSPDDAIFAVVKIQCKEVGGQCVGRILGTAFLINNGKALTAHHVLNHKTNPEKEYKHMEIWLLKRGKDKSYIHIYKNSCKFFKEVDVTLIDLSQQINDVTPLRLSLRNPKIGDKIKNIGYSYKKGLKINLKWVNNKIVITDYNIPKDLEKDKLGTIIWKGPMNSTKCNDVKLSNVSMLQPSFKGCKGMSGGPLLDEHNNVIGLMSIGLPAELYEKEKVYAVSVNEIIRVFDRNDLYY